MNENWAIYYCDNSESTVNEYPGYVDVISIDIKNKRYVLDIHCDERCMDGYYEDDTEKISVYMSREVFEMLLIGVKEKGYTQVKEKD